jgi:hypothetical protein
MLIKGTVIAAALAPGSAHAETDAADLLRRYNAGNEVVRTIVLASLSGIENGFGWANAQLNNKKQAPLYCPPGKLALADEQLLDTLRRYTAEHPTMEQKPYGMVLLFALQDVFPC